MSHSDDEEGDMRCVICKAGDTAPGKVAVTLERRGTMVTVPDVPAEICRNCGEYYLDDAAASKVYAQGEALAPMWKLG
jgi:YgiT-type zinc finger domain-containing protein